MYPYSPYYHRLLQENGIYPSSLRTYEDFLKIPITSKEHHLQDPRSFAMQPSVPGQESVYKTERLSRKKMAQYAARALGTHDARDKYGPKRSFFHFALPASSLPAGRPGGTQQARCDVDGIAYNAYNEHVFCSRKR